MGLWEFLQQWPRGRVVAGVAASVLLHVAIVAILMSAGQFPLTPAWRAKPGDSLIVDPWGRVLARAGDGEGVVTAEIDRAYLAQVRRELPCLAHVRLEA